MTPVLKRLIKGVLLRHDHEVQPAAAASPSTHDLWPWVRDTQNIRTVIDIGAHNGDFAAFLASYFKPSATYVFEPLASCQSHLRAKAVSIPNLRILNIALSDHSGAAILYENSYPPSTSFLRVSEISKNEFPQTQEEKPGLVQIATLDDLINPHSLEKNILIKIDVQGLEDRVIRGGVKVFGATQCVLIEMSFVRMYEGQPLFEEVHSHLVKLGLRFAGIKNQVDSARSGQPLFAHCLYVRSNLPFKEVVPEAR